MLKLVFTVVSSFCLLNGALASSNLTGIFLGGVSAAGPSYCTSIAASTGTPAYGSYANSAYPMTLNCAQTTWLPLGSTSSGTPILHAIYYAPSSTVSASETTQQTLVTNLIQNLASTSYYAPLQTYYDGCSGQGGGNLYFKSIQWGEWTHITCSQVGTSCSSITWTDEQSILAYVFNNKLYPQNLDVWALIVDPAITEYLVDSSGARFTLGTSYCSYHAVYDYTGQGGHWIDYSVVQASNGPSCKLNLASTSNGVQYDSFIFNFIHEVIETM